MAGLHPTQEIRDLMMALKRRAPDMPMTRADVAFHSNRSKAETMIYF